MKATALETTLQKRLTARNELHLTRKLWHMLMGLAIVGVYVFSGMSDILAVNILGALLGIDLMVETIRLKDPEFNKKVLKYWGPLMRSCEANRLSGTPYYLGAALLVVAIFPKEISVLSLMFLAVGDPLASVFGVRFGHLGPRFSSGKSLIGTLAGVIACISLGLFFWNAQGVHGSDYFRLVVLGGVIGGTAELVPWDVDDNFLIPVISGFALWFLTLL